MKNVISELLRPVCLPNLAEWLLLASTTIAAITTTVLDVNICYFYNLRHSFSNNFDKASFEENRI